MKPSAQWMIWRVIKKVTAGREWVIFPILILYWLSPVDFLPFNAIDDLLLTLGGWLLFRSLHQKKPPDGNGDHQRKDKRIIDIEAEEVK